MKCLVTFRDAMFWRCSLALHVCDVRQEKKKRNGQQRRQPEEPEEEPEMEPMPYQPRNGRNGRNGYPRDPPPGPYTGPSAPVAPRRSSMNAPGFGYYYPSRIYQIPASTPAFYARNGNQYQQHWTPESHSLNVRTNQFVDFSYAVHIHPYTFRSYCIVSYAICRPGNRLILFIHSDVQCTV